MLFRSALESEDEKQITNAVKDLIKNCVISRIKVDQLPIFDLEYIFLNIRAASIGESITLTVTCQDDNETKVDVKIPISAIEVFKPEGHSPKIEFDEEFGVVMNYPSMKRFIELDFLSKDLDTDEVFALIAESIDQIYQGEDVFDSTTTTKNTNTNTNTNIINTIIRCTFAY